MQKTYQIEVSVAGTEATSLLFITATSFERSKGFSNIITVDGKEIVFGMPIVSIEEVDQLRQAGYAESYPVNS